MMSKKYIIWYKFDNKSWDDLYNSKFKIKILKCEIRKWFIIWMKQFLKTKIILYIS